MIGRSKPWRLAALGGCVLVLFAGTDGARGAELQPQIFNEGSANAERPSI